jgi:hypothetical protein
MELVMSVVLKDIKYSSGRLVIEGSYYEGFSCGIRKDGVECIIVADTISDLEKIYDKIDAGEETFNPSLVYQVILGQREGIQQEN